MKRILLSLTLLLTLMPIGAQKRKSTQPQVPKITLEEAISDYDFATAESLLESEITSLRRKKQSTLELEERQQWLHMAQLKLNAVERVTFIDSLKVARDKVLNYIHISPECGAVSRYADFFHAIDTLGCMVFTSQMGDKIFFSKPDGSGTISLYESDIYTDGTSSLPTPLNGISNSDDNQNYPFVLTDGTTIYFAAQGSESLGGYDIFMSRYDADEHRFLAPENIGMPFNSPANDYLYLIDEQNQLGWFVTDRNCKGDTVCIYTFIPNETRRIYLPEETEAEVLRCMARITRIQDTWTDEQEVRAAQFRLRNTKSQQATSEANALHFVINDSKVCHQLSDFHSPLSNPMLKKWETDRETLRKVRATLTRLRKSYHHSAPAQRHQLESEILALEADEEKLNKQIRQTENNIRKAELGIQ